MDVINCILMVKLCGGPMDGDTVALLPNGSCRPPQQLGYLTTKNDQAAWAIYESRDLPMDWVIGHTEAFFDYAGLVSCNRQERL